jgi:hypothetical protein
MAVQRTKEVHGYFIASPEAKERKSAPTAGHVMA